MGIAKVVSLRVRPFQASHLCFEVGGILGESDIELGASVAAFDFTAFYATLGSMPTIPNHPARLLYDFLEIQSAVKPFTVVALRAEANKVALAKAINARANAFYAKYANAPAIISTINQFYSTSFADSKPNRLNSLATLSQQQFTMLKTAYTSDGRTDVVKTTQSVLDSSLKSSGSSTTLGRSDETGVSYLGDPGTFPAPPKDASTSSVTVPGDLPVNVDYQLESNQLTSTSTGSATENQTIVNTDYGYRIPFLENQAQYERAQISLIDEQFSQFMYGQNLPFLDAVFLNELNNIDGDVLRVQIAYLNTILMSPIPGTVTGIYKNPGDAVRPGEPVIRVENNDVVYLVAVLVYRGPISIGSSVAVGTTLFDLSGPPTTVTGNVVAVRGQSEDDHWEVIVKCNNLDTGGKPILPLGYHLDYDDSTVSIT